MRDLTAQEMAKVNGGYYFMSAIEGAEDGIFVAALLTTVTCFAPNPITFATALPVGAAIGAAFGIGYEAAIDLDYQLLQYVYGPFDTTQA